MNNSKAIKLIEIKKSFIEGSQRVDVLQGINLKCYHGKWYTIYGASGSGKTTLLNIMGGLEEPDSGQVLYEDVDVYKMHDRRLSNWRNSKVGFVFQFFYLIAELSVEKNVVLPLNINGFSLDKEWFEKVVNLLNIEKLLKRSPVSLSGGEKQRVAMARAVINKPDFIIADEPTGNLDSENSRVVINLMKELKEKSNVGIILATHERELMDMGEYKFQLKDGLIE